MLIKLLKLLHTLVPTKLETALGHAEIAVGLLGQVVLLARELHLLELGFGREEVLLGSQLQSERQLRCVRAESR